MASQALWRVHPEGGKGLDGTVAYDWSPGNINRNKYDVHGRPAL
jgi:hypothetical protein